jgi:hypothetical protein
MLDKSLSDCSTPCCLETGLFASFALFAVNKVLTAKNGNAAEGELAVYSRRQCENRWTRGELYGVL